MRNKKLISPVTYSYTTWYYSFMNGRAGPFWMKLLSGHVDGADDQAGIAAIKKILQGY